MKKRLSAGLVVILAATLMLFGCSASKSGSHSKSSSKIGGTLVYGRGGDSVKLDPIQVTDGESLIVTKQVLETLVKYNKKTTEIEPGLARSWDVSKDGLTYTFHLQHGVKFQDGTAFNADAVVKNFDRWANGTAAKFPYYVSQFGGFKGQKSAVIKEVKAVDTYTVQINLNQKQAPFLKNIAMTPFSISSPKAIQKYGDKYIEHPVGTGPFKFKEWKRNNTITLVKNENYWKKGLPKLDTLIFKVIKDNSARLNALTNGEVDLIDGVNPSDVEKIKANQNLAMYERPSMNVGYLGFNVEVKPLNNVKVRQALSYAIDKKAIIKNFYEGTAQVAKNPFPSSISGYNNDVEDYTHDVAKAKKLLAEAGYKNGFTIDLWAMPIARPYMPNGQKIAEAIQADFAKIGVKANIKTMEWATYIEKLTVGEAPMYLMGWTGDNGDADNFLYALLDKDSINSNNYSRYANPEVHKLLIQAQTELNENKRNEIYKKVQVLIHHDAPWVPLAHSTPVLAGKNTIKGFFPHPTGTESFADVSIK